MKLSSSCRIDSGASIRHTGRVFSPILVCEGWVPGWICTPGIRSACEFPVEISLSPLETAEGVLVSAAIRDITD